MTTRPWHTDDRPGELATGIGRRHGKVVRGRGMVTPRKPLVLTEGGRTEELLPGRVRFSRDHPVVRKNPELFMPCDPEDEETIERHKEACERKLRQLNGTKPRAFTPAKRKFSPDRREKWRLP